jgi:hypothetical protein
MMRPRPRLLFKTEARRLYPKTKASFSVHEVTQDQNLVLKDYSTG